MPSRVKLYVYDLSRLLPTHLASSAAGCALTFKFAAHLHRSVSDVSYTFERQLCRKHFNDLMTVLHCSASHQMLHSDRSIAGGLLSSFAAGIGLGGASAIHSFVRLLLIRSERIPSRWERTNGQLSSNCEPSVERTVSPLGIFSSIQPRINC